MRALLLLCCCGWLAACEPDADADGSTDVARVVAATAAEHAEDSPRPSPLAETPAERPVLEQPLAYGEAADSNLVGYLAMPADAAEPLPGLVMIHEWWGLNDNIKSMARQLAAQGYVVLAVDLYGGKIATTPGDAQALMTSVMSQREASLANIRQAYDYLDNYAFAPTIGVIGWCLGGGLSLQTALALPDELDAVVMYYGQVVMEAALLETLGMPLLGLFAADDASIPVQNVMSFRRSLQDLGKRAEVYIYSDVGHAFANPSGGNYDAGKAAEAWAKTLEFLAANL